MTIYHDLQNQWKPHLICFLPSPFQRCSPLSEILSIRRILHLETSSCTVMLSRTGARFFCSHGSDSAELHLLKTPFSLTSFHLVAVSFFYTSATIYFLDSIVCFLREDREKSEANNTSRFSESVQQTSTKSLSENTFIKLKGMNMIVCLP